MYRQVDQSGSDGDGQLIRDSQNHGSGAESAERCHGSPPLDPLIGLPAADSNDPPAEVERHALVAVEDCDSNRLQSERD